VARPLAAMTSSKRPDRRGTRSDEALGAFEELKRGLTDAPILALPRRHGSYTLDTDASAGKSERCCCKNNPTNPRDPWAIGVASSTRPSGTTARRSGSASRWSGPPFSSVPISRGRVSRCARTTRHSSGCYTWIIGGPDIALPW